MGGFKALLLGASEYTDPAIPSLPCVLTDLTDLTTTFEQNEYRVVPTEALGTIGVTGAINEVERFLAEAAHGDTLLIYVSGHGVHIDGVDYFVPSDARPNVRTFTRTCVPIDWREDIDDSKAGTVIVLVDACREGFDQSKALQRWSQGRRELVGDRRIAYVFGCKAGEYARWDTDENGVPFSFFSRALRNVLNSARPHSLKELVDLVGTELDQLTDRHGAARQHVRVEVNAPLDDIVVFPPISGGADTGRHGNWAALVEEHLAWQRAGDGPAVDALRAATADIARHLGGLAERELAGNPWWDSQLGRRTRDRVGFLLKSVLEKLTLSPAEAALLSVLPFFHQAFWAQALSFGAALGPTDFEDTTNPSADRADFERFRRGHPRLVRRAREIADSDEPAAAAIGWWIMRRWLAERVPTFDESRVEELLPRIHSATAAETFTGRRLREVLRAMVSDPGYLARTDRRTALASEVTILPNTADDQPIRERLVGYLGAIALGMAIDPAQLSEVLVNHIGIADSVSLPEVQTTIGGAVWEQRGVNRVLSARCTHPAAEVALREHVDRVDGLLQECQAQAGRDSALSPLLDLPPHVTADRVGPRADGAPAAYHSAGLRFHLDESRVQELLMGQQLYGDPALAIRELYQNALDACRYRRARLTYLERTKQEIGDWTGRIEFTQGIDAGGREYLTCQDNGIGMGIRELTAAFAQAGTCFADLPEFLEEQDAWNRLENPVEFFPNSRFGIGVLSYFMLADAITVETCRLSRDGRPGERLRVTIAGPGSLFRIEPLGPGTEAGTSVTLHLYAGRAARSCVDLLRRLLWVAEFETSATDGAEVHHWAAGKLSPAAPLGQADPLSDQPSPASVGGERTPHAVESSSPDIWWCSVAGGLLADGLWAGTSRFGSVVNLRGALAPTLSVDRRTIRAYRESEVRAALVRAVPSLVRSDPFLPDHDWITDLAEEDLSLADYVTAVVTRLDPPGWRVENLLVSAKAAGCFSIDRLLVQNWEGGRRWSPKDTLGVTYRSDDVPDSLAAWRLHAFTADTEFGPALPSDVVLLTNFFDQREIKKRIWRETEFHSLEADLGWAGPGDELSLLKIIAAAMYLNRKTGTVARRATSLGLSVPPLTEAAWKTLDAMIAEVFTDRPTQEEIVALAAYFSHPGWRLEQQPTGLLPISAPLDLAIHGLSEVTLHEIRRLAAHYLVPPSTVRDRAQESGLECPELTPEGWAAFDDAVERRTSTLAAKIFDHQIDEYGISHHLSLTDLFELAGETGSDTSTILKTAEKLGLTFGITLPPEVWRLLGSADEELRAHYLRVIDAINLGDGERPQPADMPLPSLLYRATAFELRLTDIIESAHELGFQLPAGLQNQRRALNDRSPDQIAFDEHVIDAVRGLSSPVDEPPSAASRRRQVLRAVLALSAASAVPPSAIVHRAGQLGVELTEAESSEWAALDTRDEAQRLLDSALLAIAEAHYSYVGEPSPLAATVELLRDRGVEFDVLTQRADYLGVPIPPIDPDRWESIRHADTAERLIDQELAAFYDQQHSTRAGGGEDSDDAPPVVSIDLRMVLDTAKAFAVVPRTVAVRAANLGLVVPLVADDVWDDLARANRDVSPLDADLIYGEDVVYGLDDVRLSLGLVELVRIAARNSMTLPAAHARATELGFHVPNLEELGLTGPAGVSLEQFWPQEENTRIARRRTRFWA
ncbi:caspase family protein [Cryptosporangium sp. NPDC051539]|uniref:HD domain-containing protein n=1 Tax=Cryptosporangium sp. NPDC051539 TaxID=3363962 RepID=UPI0037AE378E